MFFGEFFQMIVDFFGSKGYILNPILTLGLKFMIDENPVSCTGRKKKKNNPTLFFATLWFAFSNEDEIFKKYLNNDLRPSLPAVVCKNPRCGNAGCKMIWARSWKPNVVFLVNLPLGGSLA